MNNAPKWLGAYQRLDRDGVERVMTPLRELEVFPGEKNAAVAAVLLRVETATGELVRLWLTREEARRVGAELARMGA